MMARSQLASCFVCALLLFFPSLASSSSFPQLYRHNRYKNVFCIGSSSSFHQNNVYKPKETYFSFFFKMEYLIQHHSYSGKHSYRLKYNFVIYLKLLYFNLKKDSGLNFNDSYHSLSSVLLMKLSNELNLPVISIIVNILAFRNP